MKIKKVIITSAMSVLFLAASVFAFNGATTADSCPLKQAVQNAETDYSKVVFSKADENCCRPGADCCKGGACCKNKRN